MESLPCFSCVAFLKVILVYVPNKNIKKHSYKSIVFSLIAFTYYRKLFVRLVSNIAVLTGYSSYISKKCF